jgi:hypothetical protein
LKSLADNYRESHTSNHETIADLVFNALVVLILFILALSIEVNQRVNAKALSVPPPVKEVERIDSMSPEEVKALANKLRLQQEQIRSLETQLKKNKAKVEKQVAALAGEQRFTGAREPAAFSMAYDYRKELYCFAPSKDVDHADRHLSGESLLEYRTRKIRELADIALRLRRSRGFKQDEAIAIYSALSTYNEVVDSGKGYGLQQTDVSLYYHTLLSEYVVGDVDSSDISEVLVTSAIYKMGATTGPKWDGIYPTCKCQVDTRRKTINVNGVELSSEDLLGILLSISGRGVVLDFEGYQGEVPTWLYDEVLVPAGYVSKTPKLPIAD